MNTAGSDYGLWGACQLHHLHRFRVQLLQASEAARLAKLRRLQRLHRGGFTLLSKSWHVLYHAQRRRQLATEGPYQRVRHPQYIGFVAIMFGFLLQWPTLLTLLMFPVLVLMYVRLAISEERDAERAFGDAWRAYAAVTPRFVPRWSRDARARAVSSHPGS